MQYELDSGPCVDAAEQQGAFVSNDLSTDERWPEFGPRASAELGLASLLAIRLVLPTGEPPAGLNMYSTKRDAYDTRSERVGTLLATHCATAVTAVTHRERAEHLSKALISNRDIGTATGILMALHKLPRDEAFTLLRVTSQASNRKLHAVALDVIDTGALPPTRR